MTIWKPGMRCVCVDAEMHNRYSPYLISPNSSLHGLRKGAVYTVAALTEHEGLPVLVLEEIVRPGEPKGFAPERFRPLSETRLDILRKHLAPVDRERADA